MDRAALAALGHMDRLVVEDPREVDRPFGGDIGPQAQLTATRIPLTGGSLLFGLAHHQHHTAALQLLQQQADRLALTAVAGWMGDQLPQR